MRKGDWIALGVIGVAAYFLVKARRGGASGGTALDVVTGDSIVGFLDTTQNVQYDPSTGYLYGTKGTENAYIATVAAGQGAEVFADPQVQSIIARWQSGG